MSKHPFEIAPGTICFTSSFCNLLKFHGIDMNESRFIGLTTGLTLYSGIDADGLFNCSCADIRYSENLYRDLFTNYGSTLHHVTSANWESVPKMIADAVDAYGICIASCDVYELDYQYNYHRQHTWHALNITGCGETSFHIHDSLAAYGSSEQKTYVGWNNSLLRALDLKNTSSRQNDIWFISPPLHGSPLTAAMVSEAIQRHCGTFLEGRPFGGFPGGVAAFDQLRTYITDMMAQKDDTFYRSAFSLYLEINVLGGGPAKYRRLYAAFLEEQSRLFGFDLAEWIDSYREIGKSWQLLANYVMKAAVANQPPYLEKALRLLEAIKRRETEAALGLNAKLASG